VTWASDWMTEPTNGWLSKPIRKRSAVVWAAATLTIAAAARVHEYIMMLKECEK